MHVAAEQFQLEVVEFLLTTKSAKHMCITRQSLNYTPLTRCVGSFGLKRDEVLLSCPGVAPVQSFNESPADKRRWPSVPRC